MALSTCIKCGNHFFEIKEHDPPDSNFKFWFVQCSSCGGVIGVMDFYNVGAVLTKICKKLSIDIDS